VRTWAAVRESIRAVTRYPVPGTRQLLVKSSLLPAVS
jgi:hypothetical protein